MYRIILNKYVYCVVYTIYMNVLAASYKYFNNSSNIMYISLIRILIISVRAIYFGVYQIYWHNVWCICI